MSFSKKKYTFIRKKSEKSYSTINSQQLENSENESIFKDKNNPLNQNIDIDDLIYNTNTKKITNRELISPLPFNDPKKESPNNATKEQQNLDNNKNLQYLINQNENENIDFISTLLKLKGISIDHSNKNYSSSKNIHIKRFEEENIVIQTSPTINYITLNNKTMCNKNIPMSTSTLSSNINNLNYSNNKNEEENKNNIENSSFSVNEIKKYDCKDNKNNVIKNEQNIILNEIILETEKMNYANSHTNKETVSSSESNTNNTLNLNKKNDNDLINLKKYIKNKNFIENYNNKNIDKKELEKIDDNDDEKIKNNSITHNKNEMINQSLSKKNISDKKYVNNNMQKSKEKELNMSSNKKIILNKKITKKIPHNNINKYNKNIISNNTNNNVSKNNSNSKKKKSNSKTNILEKDIKINKSEFSIKNSNSKSNIKKKLHNKNNKYKSNNISAIKTNQNNEGLFNKKKENIGSYNKNYNKTEIKRSSINIENDSNKIEKKLIFDFIDNQQKIMKNKKEEIKNKFFQIKEIDLSELNNKNGKIKSQIKDKINKKSPKYNIIRDIPLNSERKTTKIGKMSKIKGDLSPNRINNISYLNSNNKSNKNFLRYKKIININSYSKIAKKNYNSPSLKTKNRSYVNNINQINDYEYKDNKNYNTNNLNINFDKSAVNLSKKKQIIEKDNNYLNNENIKIESKDLNKTEEKNISFYKGNYEKEFIKNNNMNNDELLDERKKEKKENINKRTNRQSKFAEIFLFDDKEENTQENLNKNEKENIIENIKSKDIEIKIDKESEKNDLELTKNNNNSEKI